MLAEKLHRQAENVVEIDGVVLRQGVLIIADDLQREIRQHAGLGVACEPLFKIKPGVLEMGNVPENGAWLQHVAVDVALAQDALDDRELVGGVINHKIRREIGVFHLKAQDLQAGGVERPRPDARAFFADHFDDAVAHFAGGLVGEGDGEDVKRRDAAFLDQVRDAVHEHVRFAAPGAGQDQQRALGGEDSFQLLRVQSR